MREVEKFSELLILEELGRAKCRNGWILMGEIARGRAGPAWQVAGRFSDDDVCLRDTLHDSTGGNPLSILSMSYSNE
jgi:hypothetical protein